MCGHQLLLQKLFLFESHRNELYLKCRRDIYWGEGRRNLNRVSTKATVWFMNFWVSDIPLLSIINQDSKSWKRRSSWPSLGHQLTSWLFQEMEERQYVLDSHQGEVAEGDWAWVLPRTLANYPNYTFENYPHKRWAGFRNRGKGWMLTSQEQKINFFSRKKIIRTIYNVYVCILPYIIMHIFLESFLISAIKG